MEETIGRTPREARFMVFNGTADGGRGFICRTEFTINQIINLVLAFEIEESII